MDLLKYILSRVDLNVLIAMVIGILVLLWFENNKSKNLIREINDLNNKISDKYETLEKSISYERRDLRNELSGKYSNLGEKSSSEHKTIKKDTQNVYEMMLLEKQNREKLYANTSRAKEILDTMDLMKEVVDRNAYLNQEVANLKIENKNLSNVKSMDYSKKLLNDLSRFESKLAGFEDFRETDEIIGTLKMIEQQLSEYVD